MEVPSERANNRSVAASFEGCPKRGMSRLPRVHARAPEPPLYLQRVSIREGSPRHQRLTLIWEESRARFDTQGQATDSRRRNTNLFDGGHTGQQNEWWGNTANFKQCDGDYAGSSGTGVLIPVNHGH